LKNGRRSGCLRNLNKYTDITLIRKVKGNPKMSAPKLAVALRQELDIDICASSVRNFLRANELNGRTASRKCFVSEANKKKRFQFANQYINANPRYSNQVVPTGEMKMDILGSDGREKAVYSKWNTIVSKS